MRPVPREPRPTFLGVLVALAIGILVMVGLGEVALRLLSSNWREYTASRFMEQTWVPGHGWLALGKPGFDGYFAQNNGDFRHHLRINADGLRNEQPASAAEGRIWVIGDSMTFGWGVEREETFAARAEALSGRAFYSVASPGSNVCGYQALVARMPKEVVPRAAVVGLVLENDIDGTDCQARKQETPTAPPTDTIILRADVILQAAKLSLMAHSALYNFLAIQLKKWDWLREALVGAGILAREHVVRNLFPEDRIDPWTDAAAAGLEEVQKLLPPGVPFAVLVVPARFEIRDGNPFHVQLRQRMIQALSARGIAVIDPLEGFRREGFAATHFAHDGHWSPVGHEVAARAVAAWAEREVQP